MYSSLTAFEKCENWQVRLAVKGDKNVKKNVASEIGVGVMNLPDNYLWLV